MACRKNHRYAITFRTLPVDQGGFGRHKCAGCAYERGIRDGRGVKILYCQSTLRETLSLQNK